MTKKLSRPPIKTISFHLDADYLAFLKNIQKKLGRAQVKAALAANAEQIKFYWEMGTAILEQQTSKQWGSRFLEQLSKDMRTEYPGMQGFSKRNLEHMRRFASLYPEINFAKQAVSQLPWGHILRLMQSIDNNEEREWYAAKCIEHGWSRSILGMQLESDAFNRQANNHLKTDNFQQQLPEPQSDLARDILKDPYRFDFLTIGAEASERAIESALTHHIRDFLLELGEGFSYVGNQVPLIFGEQEYFIDMLFYHLKLRCYIVLELKATAFKPEHTGQLGFYLAAVDDKLKHKYDNKTIGLLLCKNKNKLVAEYALQNMKAPIGISEYHLSKALPEKLKTALPSIQEIETELNTPINKGNEDV